ncbi:molybdopterin-dependent oxidoreductase [Actinopolymorpha cephalotaxi]|uniref:molybdopterin-dependent oxidoreductase n=1 Tax=Actinopolymorpha cephalotaxi TaxID=504797 RepID=UPI0036450BB7
MPAGADLRIRDLTPWRTANDVFYRIDTALSVPVVDPATWRLRIHGMVDRPLTLTIADLRRRRIVHRWVTLTCVSNEVGGDLVGNALWTGVLLDDLLKEAGVRPGADAVKSTSADGWTCGTPLSALTDGRASMLAFGMNGAPLPLEHGFPVRMVVPGLYGYVSATKWVVDIEVTRFDRFQAYWTTRGWSAQGPIKTASRIDVPASGVSVPAGTVTVAGWPGPSTAACPGSRSGPVTERGRSRGWPGSRRRTPGDSGPGPGRRRRVRTGCRCGRSTAPGRCRPRPSPHPRRTAPAATTRSRSRSAERPVRGWAH